MEMLTKTSSDAVSYKIGCLPPNRSRLIIGGEIGVVFQLPIKRPNWWWRLWQWLFCGFKWENIEGE